MPVTAKLKYLRVAPRKVRLVADLIRGKKVEEAQTILNFTNKKAAEPLFKLLKSCLANASNNFQLDPANLYVSKITVDEGPKYKRWMPRARGAASEIQKKTSHITIVLDVLDEFRKKPKKLRKVKKVKKIEELKKTPKKEKIRKKGRSSAGQTKFKPEAKSVKPKIERGIKRIFRRKAF